MLFSPVRSLQTSCPVLRIESQHPPLIDADSLLKGLDDPQLVVVDCRFDLMQPDAGRQAWAEGHIPGAHYAHLDDDLSAPVSADGRGGRHPLPDPQQFAALARSWGVSADSVVVAYDDAGGAVAGRLWWLLRWLGHERVAVLDGGLTAWAAANGPLSQDIPSTGNGDFVPLPGSLAIVDAFELAKGLESGNLILLDARDGRRFAGETEPLDRVAGHVPGAVNTPLTDNLGADKCFHSAADLQAYYRAVIGDHEGREVVCMCGSGVTACHTLLAMEAAGIRGAALYPGSWSDWISDERRPVATQTE